MSFGKGTYKENERVWVQKFILTLPVELLLTFIIKLSQMSKTKQKNQTKNLKYI